MELLATLVEAGNHYSPAWGKCPPLPALPRMHYNQ